MANDKHALTLTFEVPCSERQHDVTITLTAWGMVELFTPCQLLPEAARRLAGSDRIGCLKRLQEIQDCLAQDFYCDRGGGALPAEIPEDLRRQWRTSAGRWWMQMPTGAEQCLQKWLGPATIGSPELQAALGSADPHIRYAAALVAGGRKDRTTILKLIACANFDGNFCVQEAAVWALMELSDTQVVPTLCRWLRKDRLMAPLKARVAKALGTIGSARAVEALMAALKHEVGLVQRAAAEALGRIGEPAVEPLIATLQDWDWEVRWAASEALGPIGGPAVAPLIAALQDRNWEVQWAAVEVLGQIGDARAVGPLMAAIQDGDWAVRRAAGRALGRIGEPAVKPLMAALRDRNWAVRWAAAEALGRIGDGRAVKPLMAALRDRNYSVQWAAAEALGQIQQKQERGQR